MRTAYLFPLLGIVLLTASLAARQDNKKVQPPPPGKTAAQPAPSDFIDAATGHRIIRLSPDSGGTCLYFHQNTYTPEGDKLLIRSNGGIVAVDLTTLGKSPPKAEVVLAKTTPWFMSRKSREVYFTKGSVLWAVHVDSKALREVTKAKFTPGTHMTINCDETFTVAAIEAVDPTGKTPKPAPRKIIPQRERMFGDKIKAGIPLSAAEEKSAKAEEKLAIKANNPPAMAFTFTNLKTGEAKSVGYQYGWENHIQFSPTDPKLLLYCHEGTWHEVDRLWTIKTDGSEMRQLHKRTMDMEIDGHEFWSGDGKIVWWDNQTPRSKVFWVKGVNVYTGDRYSYSVTRNEWSGHYNVSRDGKLFCGTGGGPGSVAFAEDGQWIYAFTPELSDEMTKKHNDVIDGKLVRYGVFKSEKLYDRKKEKGFVDPNVTITPNGKWVVFTSTMSGQAHVYAVEVKKTAAKGMLSGVAPQKSVLEDAWVGTSWKRGEGQVAKDEVKTELVIGKDSYEFPSGINRISLKGKLIIDAAKGTIDFTPEDGPAKEKTLPGIYKVTGDTLTLCFTTPGNNRPTEFKSADRNTVLATYQRKK